MKNTEQIFLEEKIEYFSILPISEAEIINSRLMPDDAKTVIVFLIPYKTDNSASEGLAHFARVKDYHGFSKKLFGKIIPKFKELYPRNSFWGFADHSPVNERLLAQKGGLGDLGKNGLLINEKYGSYVFIGEVITDAIIPQRITPAVKLCTNCNKCLDVCPKKSDCLSHISQKKQKTDEDFLILKENKIVWGCDKCQEVCPLNSHSLLSPFSYFYESKISSPTDIFSMSKEEFESYAFSYRKRAVIEENLENIFKKDID